jgi:hypothetical protein
MEAQLSAEFTHNVIIYVLVLEGIRVERGLPQNAENVKTRRDVCAAWQCWHSKSRIKF